MISKVIRIELQLGEYYKIVGKIFGAGGNLILFSDYEVLINQIISYYVNSWNIFVNKPLMICPSNPWSFCTKIIYSLLIILYLYKVSLQSSILAFYSYSV